MPPETDNEVGYKKPPKHSQFKKGQSGNPRGRPRGAKNAVNLIEEALDKKIVVTENGRRRKISKAEAMATQLANRAAQGDYKATQTVLRHFTEPKNPIKPERELEDRSPTGPGTVLVLPHNLRDQLDPELLAKFVRVKREHDALKRKRQRRQNPANENEEEAPDKHSFVA
jgi:hypothetical protein